MSSLDFGNPIASAGTLTADINADYDRLRADALAYRALRAEIAAGRSVVLSAEDFDGLTYDSALLATFRVELARLRQVEAGVLRLRDELAALVRKD